MWSEYYNDTLNCYSEDKQANDFSLDENRDENGKPSPFSVKDVAKIAESLDPKKSYKHNVHWKFAPTSALMNLQKALNSFWVNGENVGDRFWEVNMTPIPKSTDKDLTVLKSWRPISVGTTEALILEKLIAMQLKDKLITSDHQFAYKVEHSTETPIKLLQTLHENNKLFWALFLDASAAFDRISHRRIRRALNKLELRHSEVV